MSVDEGLFKIICRKVEAAKTYLWFADSIPPTEDKEKKRKRKHDEREENTITKPPSTSESLKERKEKKKRRKLENASQDTLTSSTPVEASSTPSKSSPKSQISSTPSLAETTAFFTKHSITINTPSNVPQFTPIINFSQLDIPSDLRSSFDGFKEPTPIQACTWPPALDGRDVVGIAETGRYTSNSL